jgi:hypothetical protein
MDKKRQMVFNLNNFLLAFSEVLNSKKVAYIALNLGIKFGFDNKKLADLCSCALIFCLEKNSLKEFDFLDSSHLEDKTFQEIINFSTLISENFNFSKNSINQRVDALEFMKNNQKNFSKELIENFFEISKNLTFWLDENKFSYLYINQDSESFPRLFTNQVKRPDFLLLIDSIGLIAVDIKNYNIFKDKHLSLNYESEFKKTLAFERLFRLPVWYVYKNNDEWLWISALKAIEVGEIKINSGTKEQFLSLHIDDFTVVKSNNDIGKLWEQRVQFSNKLI